MKLNKIFVSLFFLYSIYARLTRLREEAQLPEKTKMAQKQEVQKKMKSLDVQVL
jgi:hypothetical protein